MSAESPAQKLVGAVLNGRYRLLRLLGEGGMGAVYEAEGIRGEGKRAVKVLHQEFVREEQILQRFHAEAQASRALVHPNIAQILDWGTAEDGTPYIVMELLQGMSLGEHLDSGKPMPPPHAVSVVYEVLQALSVAHANRIVHRDLKPDNLFLVRDARGNTSTKVLDFGIAKVIDAAGGLGSKTRTGVLLGTPGYMSPEQIKNSKAVDPRSDLWSVGAVFYEMLTATAPFPADNEFARLTAVLTEPIKPITDVSPQLAAWSPFFQRALHKDPGQRFQTADEMARAVSNVSHGLPMMAGMPGASIPPDKTSLVIQSGSTVRQAVPTGGALAGSMPAQETAPIALVVKMPAGPVAGAGGGHSTQMSPQRHGVHGASQHSGEVHVQVVEPSSSGGAPWWVVALIGLVCLGVGFLVGFIVGR